MKITKKMLTVCSLTTKKVTGKHLLGNKFLVHLKIVFVWSPTIFFLSFELGLNDSTAENLPTIHKLINAKYM